MTNPPKNRRSAYTLIELMVAVTLSLLLLIGVTDMFRNMGDTINETQATLNMGQNLNNVAMQLRADLSDGNLDVLARKPAALVASPQGTEASATGYLEINEGQGAPPDVIKDHNGGKHLPTNMTALTPDPNPDLTPPNGDMTVGDVDDILAFTASGNFRGLIDNGNDSIKDFTDAEIIWFLRGTNLYRRVLGYNSPEITAAVANGSYTLQGSYALQDLSIRQESGSPKLNDSSTLERRENRFGRASGVGFPFPLHSGTNDGWYFLRMPTVEETAGDSWPGFNIPAQPASGMTYPKPDGSSQSGDVIPPQPYWDFWENPNGWSGMDSATGSLSTYVETPRNACAGEDIIMSNVIGFDVKVWNPYWVPCGTGTNANEWAPPQYIDLGQDQLLCQDNTVRAVNYAFQFNNGANVNARVPAGIPIDKAGYGFALKGRYNTSPDVRRTNADGTDNEWYQADRIRDNNGTPANLADDTYATHSGTAMSCVFDSWSAEYINDPTIANLGANKVADPPYTEPLRGLQITIRCFEPQSGAIKQIRVVRSFQ